MDSMHHTRFRRSAERFRAAGALFAVLWLAAPAQAQDSAGEGGALSAGVAEEVTRRLNDPRTLLLHGDQALPAGTAREGNVVVLDGDLELGGEVRGDLLVVNGDVTFLAGSRVTGDVWVVGGRPLGTAAGRVEGEIVTHRGSYGYERDDGRYRYTGEVDRPRLVPIRNGSDFLVTTGRSYNRVEGLPIAFGPRLRTEGSNPLRLQALAIYRTESGLTLDVERMGYFVRADQYLAGTHQLRLGGTLHSLVEPIEDWHLSDLESGLATFFLHRDYRDHFERRGWTGFIAWEPPGSPWILDLEGRWEKHESLAAGSPWSVFRNAEPWRPQPLVAEGRLGSVAVQARYDSRSPEWNPSSGWWLRGELEQALRMRLRQPAMALLQDPEARLETRPYDRFLRGFVDVRSYNRVDADSRLNLRVVAGGSLTGDPLPPQRQHAMGGEGSLPGYPLFGHDCGARAAIVTYAEHAGTPTAVPFFRQYGCDAFGILQAEFRGKLSFRIRWDGGPWRDPRDDEESGSSLGWDMSPDWAIFVDAGRGWTFAADRPDEETRVDVGFGLLLERFGIYFAVPVSSGSRANLFVRLGPRF